MVLPVGLKRQTIISLQKNLSSLSNNPFERFIMANFILSPRLEGFFLTPKTQEDSHTAAHNLGKRHPHRISNSTLLAPETAQRPTRASQQFSFHPGMIGAMVFPRGRPNGKLAWRGSQPGGLNDNYLAARAVRTVPEPPTPSRRPRPGPRTHPCPQYSSD